MIKTIAIFSLILSSTIAFSQNYSKQLKGVDKDLNSLLETCKAAGFAVAVVHKDEVIYSKGFGYRDYENQKPVDENTLFAIGSCSKSFTAGLLGLLREDDKLSFDDRPSKHIPYLRFFNDEMNQQITIKDMMVHRTGLPRHDWSWYVFPTKSKDSLLKRVEFHEPFTGVRQQWFYNNFMYLAQGVIAEKITGKSWEENIETRFFKPLGMDRSNTSIIELESTKNASYGYTVGDDEKIKKEDYYDISGMSPAGSINSSVSDMSKWLSMWINSGKVNGESFLPEYYVNEATGPQMVMRPTGPDAEHPDLHFSAYGYGWMTSSYKGHYRVEHGGNIDGFSASVSFFPSDSIGIVVLTNQSGSSVTWLARNLLSDRLLSVERSDWVGEFKEELEKSEEMKESVQQEEEVKESKPSAHELSDFEGLFRNDGYGTIEIAQRNDSLFLEFPAETLWLKHEHYDIFEPFLVENGKVDSNSVGAIRANFLTNNAGEINVLRMRMESTVDEIEFKRIPKTIDVATNDLERFVGKYELMGVELSYYIKNNVLYALVPGQPEYELQATSSNKFLLKIVEGYSMEFIEVDGEVTEVEIVQPNGTFRAKRK